MPEKLIEAPTAEEIAAGVETEFSYTTVLKRTAVRRMYFSCDRRSIRALCQYLKDAFNFEHITSLCGVDWTDRLQVVYHLSNYCTGMVIEITVDIPNDDPRIDSVALIWEGANWHERETYELFGIVFEGHPKLERLLTPQNYEFFPFRKSYKLRGQE
ncbi:MAG: NADH-quinone oxidoreductase subunit C [Methanomassiliicoccaceae archaeon]|jgi:NADH-quinone oxidoreductase subunit C|nr:NADH-quinone oxidoreductase subunit C [Methanomassiliicoccaceae archaeon]